MTTSTIGICGAGIGGLAAAIGIARQGHRVVVFEQARAFARVGADINLTPNAVHAIDGLGVGTRIRETAARTTHRISRTWDTGEETSRIEMAESAEKRYGAPQLTLHRADLMHALESAVDPASIRFNKKTTGVTQDANGVTVQFADGTHETVDALIGADGIHSAVRTALFGPEHPTFTGVVAYRCVVPRERLAGVTNLDAFTKWWGPSPELQLVVFPLNQGKDIFVFATVPQDAWRHESWTTPGAVTEFRDAYGGFHPEARRIIDACSDIMKSALYVRDPLPRWSEGAITLLGDACHPMMPFMAQGAGMAIEDAVVLSRCIALDADPRLAFKRYEAARKERTAKIQIGSRGNEWLREGTNADWVYAYDAWKVAL